MVRVHVHMIRYGWMDGLMSTAVAYLVLMSFGDVMNTMMMVQ